MITSFLKLNFKLDWKVLLEFGLNEFTLYITLLGIEYNILVNILRILECEGSIKGDLMCASEMLENDSYV